MTSSGINKEYEQFLRGLQVIEREIVSGVRHVGGQVDEFNFRWHGGQKLIPPPSELELKITTPDRTLNVFFSREEVEDSEERIGRPEVRSKVRDVVAELTRPAVDPQPFR
jgi:hypothetical protein